MTSPSSAAVLFVSGRRTPLYELGAWVRRRGGRPLYAASFFEAFQTVIREAPAVAVVLPGAVPGAFPRLRRLLRRHHPAVRILRVDPRGPARRFVLRLLAHALGPVRTGFSLVGGGRS